jgi:hypothetical protein
MRLLPRVEDILAGLTVIRWRHHFTQPYPVASDPPGTECELDNVSYKSKTDLSYPYADVLL